MPVNYAHGGFIVGYAWDYKTVAAEISAPLLWWEEYPAFCANSSQYRIESDMQTASNTGELRLPIPLLTGNPANRITFTNIKPAGTCIASVDGYFIGTLYRGNCTSQRSQQTFYDVAFPRITRTANQAHTTGIMLDSETFDSEQDALDFLTSLVLASEVSA